MSFALKQNNVVKKWKKLLLNKREGLELSSARKKTKFHPSLLQFILPLYWVLVAAFDTTKGHRNLCRSFLFFAFYSDFLICFSVGLNPTFDNWDWTFICIVWRRQKSVRERRGRVKKGPFLCNSWHSVTSKAMQFIREGNEEVVLK